MRKILLIILYALCSQFIPAQGLPFTSKLKIESFLTQVARKTVYVPDIKIDSTVQKAGKLSLYANINLSYIRFDNRIVGEIYRNVKAFLPTELSHLDLQIITDTRSIEFFITANRTPADFFVHPRVTPLVENLSKQTIPTKGLLDTHLAIWQSHGLYYSQPSRRWEFQRARLFQTVEDLFTQSFVLPFLTPMLENAGAYVFIPRERDTQKNEIIIDNDGSKNNSEYRESNGSAWSYGTDSGFANRKTLYLDKENPFRMGTYRQTNTSDNILQLSSCEWIPEIPERGKYAVYISYKSLPQSTEDAHYTVYHLGGQTKFSVNQRMGGGTWIFLGFFMFEKGKNDNCKVVLTNYSQEKGYIVTADALKIGGGMGNIARQPFIKPIVASNDSVIAKPLPTVVARPSFYPRYTEGARYWLQWAGVPDSVYSRTKGENDYLDDFQSRGNWVNYLAGGSSVLPFQNGLNIPIDLAFALHSDAGSVAGDSIVGTLGICMTQFNNQLFENGKTRWVSRDLTEYIMNEVVTDIRTNFEPEWTRRQLWNRSYSEARVPNVPTTLLEVLSHQNFADMRYGSDPNFRFAVSRSIYKGMLKFVAQQQGRDYVVQPLPISAFYTKFIDEEQVQLGWEPQYDPAEPTAVPTKYIVFTREGNNDFDNGTVVSDNTIRLKIEKDKIYSYKVVAANEGGESFPSEILSLCRKSHSQGTVLVINGFDRISGPDHFAVGDSIAGFADYVDHGVPYIQEYSYVGPQTEFRRNAPFVNNESPGFGASANNYETRLIVGNTFDYPYLHGKSIAAAGYSFASSSRDAITNGALEMGKFSVVDIILGKQKQTKVGRGTFPAKYKTFDSRFQAKISNYCGKGGNILVSGAYVGTDLWKNGLSEAKDIEFATKILKYKFESGRATTKGFVEGILPGNANRKFHFEQQLNDKILAVESPDAISPADSKTGTILRYSDTNLGAGTFFKGNYSSCILGFPIEAVSDENSRTELMSYLLELLGK